MRIAGIFTILGLVTAATAPAHAQSWIEDALRQALDSGAYCGRQAAAIEGSVARLRDVDLPASGRFIFVNTAAQSLTAYQDGDPVLQSRVVVGKDGWETPDFSTGTTFVEFNPTWNVPKSIARSSGMFDRDEAWLERQDMDVRLADGRVVAPDASSRGQVVGFVQRPGPDNALGRVKIGLAGTGGILLHDTNDPTAFGAGARALSHGCIRVEAAAEVAAFVLERGTDEARMAMDAGTTVREQASVPVVVAYFTALPDETGQIVFFEDIYGRDPAASSTCEGRPEAVDNQYRDEPAGGVVWREREVR